MDNFNILPAEIALDILTRVPGETVLACKSVSKTWRDLVQQPCFYHMHLNHGVATDSGKLSFLALAENQKLYYFEYKENHETPIVRISLTSPFKYANTFVGSLNGLICLRDDLDVGFCICNPMTREYVILPKPSTNPGRHWSSGFGYLASTNEYKVVSLYGEHREPNSLKVLLYTLGSGNGWRNVGKLDFKPDRVSSREAVFLNGALYWLTKTSPRVIVVFDLANENFREQIPPLGGIYWSEDNNQVGVLGGFLIYTASEGYIQNGRHISYGIWLLKEQEKEYQPLGWVKEFILSDNKLLDFTKSGGILSYNSKYLNIYDPKTSTSTRMVDFSTDKFCQVHPHTNTLLSLKELGEKDAKIMESGWWISAPNKFVNHGFTKTR